jgi:hypothetical protein
MKIVQVVPKSGTKPNLKSLLKSKERALRGTATTFRRKREGRWVHVRYPGWISWKGTTGGLLVAEVKTKKPDAEWQLLQAFIGYLDRHFRRHIENISITYR